MKNTERNKHSQAEDFLQSCSTRVEKKLEAIFRTRTNSYHLIDAIRYSTLGVGKKIRPSLIYATAQITATPFETVDDIACAIELIHAYSLIHDDLPAMDDDDMRRGRPTLHKAFDEALAILSGDAMQTMAFEILADSTNLNNRCKIQAIKLLAEVAGTEGMAGGQTMDIALAGTTPNIGTVEVIHRLKTGSLMSACINMLLICNKNLPLETQRALKEYAQHIGLCFQIRDDILDLKVDMSCERQPTYPATLGLENSQKELHRLGDLCLASLNTLDASTQTLTSLTQYIIERKI